MPEAAVNSAVSASVRQLERLMVVVIRHCGHRGKKAKILDLRLACDVFGRPVCSGFS